MKKIEWSIRDGRKATVEISIDKHIKTINDDFMGEIMEESNPEAWTIKYHAEVEGLGDVNDLCNPPTTDGVPAGYVGRIGKLCYTAEIGSKIDAAVAEIEASEDWKLHLDAEKKSNEIIDEYEAHRAEMKIAMSE